MRKYTLAVATVAALSIVAACGDRSVVSTAAISTLDRFAATSATAMEDSVFARPSGAVETAEASGNLRSSVQSSDVEQIGERASLAANVIANGTFGTATSGNLTGWTTFTEGNGSWATYTGTTANGFPVAAPPSGFAAFTTQNGPGAHFLYQDFTVPADAELEFDVAIYNRFTTFVNGSALTIQQTNQLARVDIMDPNAAVSALGTGVLLNVFATKPGDAALVPYRHVKVSLAAFAGRKVRLRFATVETQFFFQMAVDNVTVSGMADASPPVVTPTVTGTLGTLGWYTSDVDVSWATSDAESPITTPACASASLTENTAGTTFTCTATSAGGTTTRSVTLKRDASTPTVVATPTGTTGSNGWYVSDVDVAFAVTANGPAPVSAGSDCNVKTLATDSGGTTYECAATTEAGLSRSTSITVKRDASAPTVSGAPSGTLGANGWYTSSVNVAFSAVDATSGVTSTCAAANLSENSAGSTYSCEAVNGAGLKSSASVTVKKDDSTPVVTPTATGTMGSNGWYTSNVGISWAVTGTGPSEATSTCTVATLSNDSAGATYNCSATTGAGITATGSIAVKRDVSAPVVSSTVAGPTLNASGWYTGDVSVSWSAADNVSPVSAIPCAVNTLASDNANTVYTCSATNAAGLVGTATRTVRRDATKPLVGYTGNAGSYTVDQTIAITCSASDAMSGLAGTTCANVNGAAYTFALGASSYSATAADVAGNTNAASTSFTVSVTEASLCALVNRWTSNGGVANSLCKKIEKGNTKPFVNELEAQAGKKFISAENAAILIRLAGAL